jgi:predicted aspartyl protease
MFFLF